MCHRVCKIKVSDLNGVCPFILCTRILYSELCFMELQCVLHLQVLGQLDNKFIVTVVGPRCVKNQNVIVLFDQHAVHERIRLESLMKGW